MENKVEYVNRKGIARTKHGNQWIIDDYSFVIDETIKIPNEVKGKFIVVPMFEWSEIIPTKQSQQIKVEEAFKSFCITNKIKYESKTFYTYQQIYFNGAISVIGETPAKWGVCILGNRPIIEEYIVTK